MVHEKYVPPEMGHKWSFNIQIPQILKTTTQFGSNSHLKYIQKYGMLGIDKMLGKQHLWHKEKI